VALGERCSADSLLHRFLSPMTGIPAVHIADVLGGRRGLDSVVAATAAGDLIGLATLAPAHRGPTELAVLVEDSWQRSGVGRSLVRHVVRRARVQGTERLAVVVESTRPGLLRALTPLGPSQHFLDGPVLEAVYELV
jgi:GNAT superfamily N-acetyltransferase